MKITDNERMVLNQFNATPHFYSFWDGGYVSNDSGTYLSEFVSEMSNAMGKPESSAKTVFASMKKKGIFSTHEIPAEDPITAEDGTVIQEGKPADQWVELTDAGVELIADLRIEEDEAMLDMDVEEEPEHDTMISKAAREANARIKEARAKETQGRKAAAKADIADGRPSLRTSHADCDHPTQGKEGKIARAKCRRERAAKAKADEEKAAKKAERAAKKAATVDA